jgi:hypothetical protein
MAGIRSAVVLVLALALVGVVVLFWSGQAPVAPPFGAATLDGAGHGADPAPIDAAMGPIEAPASGGRSAVVPPRDSDGAPEDATKIRLTGILRDADLGVVAGHRVEFVARGSSANDGFFVLRGSPASDLFGEAAASAADSDDRGRFELLVAPGQTGFLRLAEASGVVFRAERGRVAVPGYRRHRDLGDLAVEPAALLGGVVRGPRGDPLASARVALSRSGGAPFDLRDRREVGADGRFLFGGLPEGSFRLRITAPGLVPHQQEIALSRGERRTDLAFALTTGARVAGIVVDDAAQPVPGANVAPRRAREYAPGRTFSDVDRDEATTTEPDGRFVLGGLEGAAVTLEVWADGHDTETRKDVPVGAENLVVELRRRSSIAGVLVDPDGHPIVGSRVFARPADADNSLPAGVFVAEASVVRTDRRGGARTDEAGAFVVENVPPGTSVVVADGTNHLRAESGPIQLRAGQSFTGLRLVAPVGASIDVLVRDGEARPIEGAVVEVRTPGRANASSFALSLSGGDALPMPMQVFRTRPIGTGTTDADGRVLIGGLPVGAVEVTATHADLVPVAPVSSTLPAAATTSVELTMGPGGFVELTVVDAVGAPAAAVGFSIEGPLGRGVREGRQRGKTDGEGAARSGPLESGQYSVSLMQAPRPVDFGHGYVMLGGRQGEAIDSTRVEVEVVAGATAAVRLVHPVLTTLDGVVRDRDGTVANARVALQRAGDRNPMPFGGGPSCTTDAEGRYRIEGLVTGDYRLEFRRDGAQVPHRVELSIPAGQAALTRDLWLGGGSARVTVVRDEDGVPVADARLTIESSADASGTGSVVFGSFVDVAADSQPPGWPRAARTGADGRAELAELPAGSYRIHIRHRERVTATVDAVEVRDGERTEVGTVRLVAGGTFAGSLQGLPEVGFVFAEVELVPIDGATTETIKRQANQREFEFTAIPAGRYRVRARNAVASNVEWGPSREVELRAGRRTELALTVR